MRRRHRGSSLFYEAEISGSVSAGGKVTSTGFVSGSTGWAIDGDGNVEFNSGEFRGALDAATGTFAGALSAATGTFAGALDAATGTFAGDISAASGTFTGTVSAANVLAGTLASGVINTGVINADQITTGTLSADFLDGGTISGTSIDINSAFTVDASGNMVATDGTFTGTLTGTVTASAATITGPSIEGGTIDIGGADATSFHVDAAGQMWLGAATYAAAPFRVTSGGSLNIGGADATSFSVDSTGQMWLGSASFATAPFRVTAGGALTATTVTATGSLRTGSTGQRVEVGRAGEARIELYTGDGDEVGFGAIDVDVNNAAAVDFAFINLVAPQMGGVLGVTPRCYIDVRHYDDDDRQINFYADTVSVNGGDFRVEDFMTNFGRVFMTALGSSSSTSGEPLWHFNGGGDEIYEYTSTGKLKGNQKDRPRSEARSILNLRPKTFDAKMRQKDGTVIDLATAEAKLDPKKKGQIYDMVGLIAEDVAVDFPDACIYDEAGEPRNIDWNAITTSIIGLLQDMDERLDALEKP